MKRCLGITVEVGVRSRFNLRNEPLALNKKLDYFALDVNSINQESF